MIDRKYCIHCMEPIPENQGRICPNCEKPWNKTEEPLYCLKPFTLLNRRYIVGEMLGQGSTGITYIGFDTALGHRVAIKEFYIKGAAFRIGGNSITWGTRQNLRQQKESMQHAAAELARLENVPEIMRVYDIFDENGTSYIISDYIEGDPIIEKIKKEGPVTFLSASSMVKPVIRVIGSLRKMGLIRSSLSYDNILFDENGQLRIIGLFDEEPRENGQYINVGESSDVRFISEILYLCTAGLDINDPRVKKGNDIVFPEECFNDEEADVVRRGLSLSKEQRIKTLAELLSELEAIEEEARELEEKRKRSEAIEAMKRDIINPVDEYNEGLRYYNGYGVKKNYKEAVRRFLIAAGDGDDKAQNNLGICYHNGNGVPKDYEEAVRWYRLSAENGNANAAYNLASCYANGEGVKKDYVEAARYYHFAAEHGITAAQKVIGDYYFSGKGVRKNYFDAAGWYRFAADSGDAEAQCSLGNCYYNGCGVERDYSEAVRLYTLSAEQGITAAALNLGLCYANGQGTNQNFEEAVKWYQIAAEHGNATAMYNLGLCYGNGQGVKQDIVKAASLYHSAAMKGNARAQCNLGFCYQYGQGVPKNFPEAVKWYRKAADKGVAMAQYNLGVCFRYGQGAQKNLAEAEKWYTLAANQGVQEAEEALRQLRKGIFRNLF